MKRKKTKEETEPKFWPIPGVDGEPYPPLVQEALDLVEKETLRRKRTECKHLNRRFQAAGRSDHGYGRFRYDRMCEDCGMRVSCEHPDDGLRRQRVEHVGGGSFLEFWECNCGKMIARRVPERTRQTGTDWLKTADQERRELKRDRRIARQISQAAEDAVSDSSSPAALLPIMGELERDIRALKEEADWLQPYGKGTLLTSGEVFMVHNAKGEAVIMVPKDDQYSHESDMSWIRTMNGRTKL
jgi:hypothetical protein